MILAPLQKLPKNVGDLGKLIATKGIKKLPKVQKIAQSGHTGWPRASNHVIFFLKKMGQTRPLFGLFSFFSQRKDKYSKNFTINDKSIDGVLES